MTTLYFAWSGSARAGPTLVSAAERGHALPLLIALPYLPVFHRWEAAHPAAGALHHPRMLDSGAFTLWKSGRAPDLDALIAAGRAPEWAERVALDVVGDPAASLVNARAMQAAGLVVTPVFHFGEPWHYLTTYCAEFSKVGLSCRFGEPERESLRWLHQCFARAWPHRFHSFGWIKPSMLLAFPFDSADSSSWDAGPGAFGTWGAYGKLEGVHGYNDVSVVVDQWRDRAAMYAHRWDATLAPLRAQEAR